MSGGRLGALAGLTEQVVGALTTAALARVLSPRDFGLVAAATIVVNLLTLPTQLGFGRSIVTRTSVDDATVSTTFWTAACIGVVVVLTTSLGSPVLASAVGHREAAPLIVVAALTAMSSLVASVPRGLLMRELRFRAIYTTDVISITCSSATALGLVLVAHQGAMAIVVGRVVGSSAAAASLLALSGWRPRLVIDLAVIREDIRFNVGVLGASGLGYLSKNIDNWTVARTASAGALGVYYVAYVLPNILRQRLTWLANDVVFPVLARLRESEAALARGYAEVLGLVSFLAVPSLTGICLLAEYVVTFAFGARWLGAVAPLRLLAVAAAVDLVSALGFNVYLACGEPGRIVRTQLVRVCALIGGLSVAASVGGLVPVAWAVLGSTVATAASSLFMLNRRVGLTLRLVVSTTVPIVVPTLAMVAIVLSLRPLVVARLEPAAAMVALAVCGATTYLSAGLLAFRTRFMHLMRQSASLLRPGGHAHDAS